MSNPQSKRAPRPTSSVGYSQMVSDLEGASPNSISATAIPWYVEAAAPWVTWNGTNLMLNTPGNPPTIWTATTDEQSMLYCEGPGDGRPPKCS
jgi:hypothetical protein